MGYFKQFAQGFYYILRSFKMIGKKKLFIVFLGLLIFVLLFSFNQKVFAFEDVSVIIANNLGISKDRNYFSNSSANTAYVQMEKGYIYTVHNGSTSLKNIALSVDVPALNGVYKFVTSVEPDESYSLLSDGEFVFLDGYGSNGLTITREKLTNQASTIQDLANSLTLNKLWVSFSPAVIIISIGVLLALGFVVFKKATKGTSKHQAKM